MEFRNTLISSIMLVVGFVCLNFYEEGVLEEFRVYDSILAEVIKEKKEGVLIATGQPQQDNEKDTQRMEALKDEVKWLEERAGESGYRKLSQFREKVEKYGLELDQVEFQGKISNNAIFRIIDSIENEAYELFRKSELKRYKAFKDHLDLVVVQKEKEYVANQSYFLNFDIVYNYQSEENLNFKYEINGVKTKVDQFPFELSYLPNEITFLLNSVNPVTGEKQKYSRVFQP